jgi:hypothetical protein
MTFSHSVNLVFFLFSIFDTSTHEPTYDRNISPPIELSPTILLTHQFVISDPVHLKTGSGSYSKALHHPSDLEMGSQKHCKLKKEWIGPSDLC